MNAVEALTVILANAPASTPLGRWLGVAHDAVQRVIEAVYNARFRRPIPIKGVQATLGNERVTRLDLLIGLRAREGASSRVNDGALRPLSTRVVSVLAGAGCPLASDEIYTAVLQESLNHSDGLAGLSLSEVERMLGEVATRDSKGRWHMTRTLPRGHARSLPEAYLFAGASFEPQADAAQPKQVQEVPSGAVQGGRNTAFYNAHSYHTKVPPEAIEPFIEHFTRPGDVVLDPFAGSGMTGVAAVLLGRRAVLNDLAIVGAHLAYNHTRPCDPVALQRAFDDLYASLLPAFRRWYRTVDERGRDGYVHYTIWSNIYVCKSCKHRFSMWSVTDTESGRVGRSLQCPSCGHSEARQSWRADANEPVFISYELDGSSKRMERKADASDLAYAQSFRVGDIKEWYPKVEVQPDREMYIRCALHLQGIKAIADFYTPRNLQALATIWDAIQRVPDERIRFALAFAFTNTAWHGTRMRRYNARGGQRPLTGTLYIPQLSSEANVLEVMANKVAQLCSYYRALTPARPEVPLPRILTGSATHLDRVPDASVDYIFTDPPFGSNIFYSDCNLIWEAWLGSVTDDRLEAVVNRSRKHAKGGKTVAEYADLMGRALAEMHRVLKPSGWVTLVFHNTDPEIWVALQESAAKAGFRIDGAAGLDRQQHSHKGYKGKNETENVAHFDVVLSMQKEALDVERLPRRRVTGAVLKATLTVAAKDDARVLSSLQWAHSVAMRRLFEGGYDLRDVSYERVADTWRPLAGRPG